MYIDRAMSRFHGQGGPRHISLHTLGVGRLHFPMFRLTEGSKYRDRTVNFKVRDDFGENGSEVEYWPGRRFDEFKQWCLRNDSS